MAATTAAVVSAAAAAGGAIADNNNQKASIKDAQQRRAQSQQYINDMVQKTQGQIFNLYQPMQQNNNAAMLAGLNLYQQAFPQALGSFNAGNMNAQQTLLQGLPQMNNALLGGQIDYSYLQPKQAAIDPAQMQALLNPQALNFNPLTQV